MEADIEVLYIYILAQNDSRFLQVRLMNSVYCMFCFVFLFLISMPDRISLSFTKAERKL